MKARTIPALRVAHDALLGLETAKGALGQIESLIFFLAIGGELPGSSAHTKNLIDIAWSLAADAANAASSNYERVSDGLDSLAPQTAQSENVAREIGGAQ